MNLQQVIAEHDASNFHVTRVGDNVTARNNVTLNTFVGTIAEFNAYTAIRPEVPNEIYKPHFDVASAKIDGFTLGGERVITISADAPNDDDNAPEGAIWFKV